MITKTQTHICMTILLAILFGFFALPPIPARQAQADWRDSLRGFTEGAKRKAGAAKDSWRKREHHCAGCGKVIHVGTKCVSCQAKAAQQKWERTKPKIKHAAESTREKWERTKPKIRDATGKVKQKWEETSPKIRNAADRVLNKVKEYAPKVRDAARNTQERLRRYGPRIKEAAATTRNNWNKMKPHIQEARLKAADWYDHQGKVLAQRAKEAMVQYGPEISRRIRDPDVRRDAFEIIGMSMEMRRELKSLKKDAAYKAFTIALDMPIQTNSGRSTIGKVYKKKFLIKFPELEGTVWAEDPAIILASVLTDKKFLVTEVPFIKRGNTYVSITQSMSETSSFDTEQAMICLELLESVEDFSAGENPLAAMESSLNLMAMLNR